LIIHPTRACALILCMVAGSTQAAAPDDLTLGVDLGSTGIGIQARLPLSAAHGLYGRLGVNTLPHYSFSKSTSQVNYDFRASLRTVDALIDWHPADNGFRISAGIIYNDNRVDGIGMPNREATFSFENGSYSTNQVGKLSGRIDFASVAPYLGIGWQTLNAAERGWHFSSDLGVMYQGSPSTSLGITGCTLPSTLCSLVSSALAPAIATEARRLDDELKDYRFFPVVRVGLNYRF
jgi:opacity protein-like surface antigen